MVKSELEKITHEKLLQGGILVKMYFDMQNQEKEKLQPLLVDLINEHLLKEKGVVYCYGAIEEPIKLNELYSTSAEVTILFENIFPLVNIAFNYTPIGLEILKPDKEFVLKMSQLQSLILEISNISTNYSRYILQKVLKPDDLALITKEIENRIEMGKKVMEKLENNKKEQT
ncbi:MAG: hypothetical protein M1168_01370 [Candidatus Marsarchaeota archaeon]|nr:hypothetical protein [Candidatus Marsarchaeota archaeon]MCL5094613.1 hypothetical protein [Candidatus Marsarchaeota archaeon]